MKQPEEIFNEWMNKAGISFESSYQTYEKIIAAMKEYGKQQYNQAIKDAVEKAKIKPKYKSSPGFMDQYTVDKESILKLLK